MSFASPPSMNTIFPSLSTTQHIVRSTLGSSLTSSPSYAFLFFLAGVGYFIHTQDIYQLWTTTNSHLLPARLNDYFPSLNLPGSTTRIFHSTFSHTEKQELHATAITCVQFLKEAHAWELAREAEIGSAHSLLDFYYIKFSPPPSIEMTEIAPTIMISLKGSSLLSIPTHS